ncbi:MAG: transcription termination factor Rho [Peptoniphilus harei]|uniref:transcription termination factor Rho n=1 Tax=Peptoniphilus harei TaxID=54005 RepID=UPI00290B4E52|nr:transcription termination factor Rho [Peptoniphilus harei]MDU5470474.1 transcription termination factor Rho [Peptoniphilus harei]MDU6097663.1 transcription termination factor Rho [Peptoniphilus harei]
MTNKIELNNKSIDDLRKIALSLGLENPENYNVEDLKEFIETGKTPASLLVDKDLDKLKVSELRELAKEYKIEKSYSLKKDELIKEIKLKKESQKIDKLDLSDNAAETLKNLDNKNYVRGILELHQDGYGFLRTINYLPSEEDIYVSPSQIRKFRLRNGDEILGIKSPPKDGENFNALLYIKSVNNLHPSKIINRPFFDNLTPIYPKEKINLETEDRAMRIIDLLAPVGFGQRGLIVSQPKSGKTTLLKKISKSINTNYPDLHLIVLLVDERPEEVTDMKRSVKGEVVYSTFDENPKNHTRVAEMVIDRAKRLVENKEDVVILLDSLTRLSRAYNLTTPASGKTLSGGLDPLSLHKPKRFFGAARNIEEGGSLTILATALVDTGSRMDDVIFEEFKGTGNMELHLNRSLSEKRIFPAIDILKSGTRKEELLLSKRELDFSYEFRNKLSEENIEDVTERFLDSISKTKNNKEFLKKYFVR